MKEKSLTIHMSWLFSVFEKQNTCQTSEKRQPEIFDPRNLVHNCTIFLGSLDVRNIDDQCRGPSRKEKDHLVG